MFGLVQVWCGWYQGQVEWFVYEVDIIGMWDNEFGYVGEIFVEEIFVQIV